MRKAKGFTLIELLIVLVIIAILAAIAYPTYLNQVRKTRTSQMREGVMQVATQLERLGASTNGYPKDQASVPGWSSLPYTSANTGGLYFSYTYTSANPNSEDAAKVTAAGDYMLAAQESTARFQIKTWVNSRSTRCYCSNDANTPCGATAFTATTTSCSGVGTAF